MRFSQLACRRLEAVLALVLLSAPSVAAGGLSQSLCSSQNTGSGSQAVSNIYQSNGACYTQCQNNYAFAIVQGQNCWCSNYAPADQIDVSSCNQNCPGYPSEQCGNSNNDLYGYVALPKSPSGTIGNSAAATTTQTSSSSAPTSTAAVSTSQSTSEPVSAVSSSSTASSTVTAMTMTTSASVSLIISTEISTVSGGGIVTRTVTSNPTIAPDGGASIIQSTKNNGLSKGAVAGVAIGSVLGFAILAALVFGVFMWFRKRRDGGETDPEQSRRGSPKRNTSVLSRTGLLNESREKPEVPALTITRKSSTNMMMDTSTTTPISTRRNSQPLIYDQRLNPSLLMANDNASRTSVGTMQDNRDYTRPLGVMNPDPPGRD